MARKKIVFVIVEGPSDDNAIGYFIDKLFDKNRVYVHVMHCDITTERGVNYNNIPVKCCDVVKNFARNNGYKKENFERIIHIVDTDGAYVDSDSIVESSDAKQTFYTTENIVCKNKQNMEERNNQKTSVLNRLITCGSMWGSIPYAVYYMSCNLDHVLYDKQNSNDDEKEQDAYSFVKKYKDDVAGFLDYICNSDFSVSGAYRETWDFIKKDRHSLNRHTNLGLCFSETK